MGSMGFVIHKGGWQKMVGQGWPSPIKYLENKNLKYSPLKRLIFLLIFLVVRLQQQGGVEWDVGFEIPGASGCYKEAEQEQPS